MTRRLVPLLVLGLLAGCLGPSGEPQTAEPAPALGPYAAEPTVVVAHIDTGVNPYHGIFRDDSARAQQHPSTYIEGYPAGAQALTLTRGAVDYASALEHDRELWQATEPNTLYWVPGTRIIGLIGPCEQSCGGVHLEPDPHGHGTMTASRSVGPDSLAPTARFVSVQGLSGAGVRWAADQGWIDVQTNSWLSLVPPQAEAASPFEKVTPAFAYAGTKMLTLAASGNGAAYGQGFAPTPTYALSTAPAGVILVGAHDNGYVTLWHGQPAHVVADGYGGPRGDRDTIDGYGANRDSCCTSAASPYAAGGAAAILLEARRILNDTTPGTHEGVVAQAGPGIALPSQGPLVDGKLTLAEFKELFLATATPRPGEGPHDGLLHWSARGGAPTDPADPGENPYCPGCWTLPQRWTTVPAAVPAYPVVGYGSIDLSSVEAARLVLRGERALPDRSDVDAYYDLDQRARDLVVEATLAGVTRSP